MLREKYSRWIIKCSDAQLVLFTLARILFVFLRKSKSAQGQQRSILEASGVSKTHLVLELLSKECKQYAIPEKYGADMDSMGQVPTIGLPNSTIRPLWERCRY